MDIAVEVLAEKGYRDASMLAVARRARASKETLYAWFGDKSGLFEAIIARNARNVQAVLARHLTDDAPLETALADFGRALLELLLGDSAVAINRAAISEAPTDPSLSRLLASTGRDATLPAFVAFLDRHAARGALAINAPADAAQDFLGLVLADLQVRRLLGLLPVPEDTEIDGRAVRATAAFLRLYGTRSL
ncbi:MAG: TetR family transcriptional regulator [Hyphomicrobiales bacterium]|nr:TetR family transcriptional regulator [Hyphomicrobiales bacterium]